MTAKMGENGKAVGGKKEEEEREGNGRMGEHRMSKGSQDDAIVQISVKRRQLRVLKTIREVNGNISVGEKNGDGFVGHPPFPLVLLQRITFHELAVDKRGGGKGGSGFLDENGHFRWRK